MSEYATKGAMMRCMFGTTPAQLQVTSNTSIYAQDNFVATTADKIPMTNIPSFGTCNASWPSRPCVPSPLAWTGFQTTIQIPGGNPLLKTSMINCALGGCIQFQNSGQMKPSKIVINPTSPQIQALQKAALSATPFCEECEKKEKEKKPKILRIYWMDEQGEPRELSELEEGIEVTLCVDVEEGGVGKTVDIIIDTDNQKKFKGGKQQLKYSGLTIENDNTAYIDNFKIEYQDE